MEREEPAWPTGRALPAPCPTCGFQDDGFLDHEGHEPMVDCVKYLAGQVKELSPLKESVAALAEQVRELSSMRHRFYDIAQ